MLNLKTSITLLGLLIGLSSWQLAVSDVDPGKAFPTVGAVTAFPTNNYHPGKVIWVDLVTTDVARAATFYNRVFGWEFKYLANKTYAQASYQGHPVGAIAEYNDDQAVAGDAQWLVSFSSSDIDGATKKAIQAGGKVLEGPENLDGRGRWVMVSDPEGAELMLLNATGGDPADRPSELNEWLWAELWTTDAKEASKFYLDVVGLKSFAIEDEAGKPYTLLGRDGVARAGVVKSPFDGVEPNWLAYILVKNIKETVGSIEKNGGKVVMAPGASADQVTTAIVSDPTGGVFAIQQRGE